MKKSPFVIRCWNKAVLFMTLFIVILSLFIVAIFQYNHYVRGELEYNEELFSTDMLSNVVENWQNLIVSEWFVEYTIDRELFSEYLPELTTIEGHRLISQKTVMGQEQSICLISISINENKPLVQPKIRISYIRNLSWYGDKYPCVTNLVIESQALNASVLVFGSDINPERIDIEWRNILDIVAGD